MALTWARLVKLEPRLQVLAERARQMRDDKSTPTYCATHRWIGCANRDVCEKCRGGLKSELVRLVGWRRQTGPLSSSAAYDTAYEHVYSLLSDCRSCSCL